jgi:hypothetical protein
MSDTIRTERPTLPPDDALEGQISELTAALRNVCQLAIKLETSLLQTKIALVTEEAQVYRAHERLDGHALAFARLAERVLALEEAQAAE